MVIILEFFLTVFVALLFSFLVAKLVSLASVSGVEGKCSIHASAAAADDDDIIMEHVDLTDKSKVQSFESENKVGFVKVSGDNINKVYVFKPVDDDDHQGFECENKVDVFKPVDDDDQGFECENEVDVFKPVVVDDDDQGFECENKGEEKAVEIEVIQKSKVEAFESEKEVEFMQESTAQVELKAKPDDIVVENKIEEIESQNEESQLKELVEEEEEEEEEEEKEENIKVESDGDDDDGWEEIEKSELENVFAAAAKFTEQK